MIDQDINILGQSVRTLGLSPHIEMDRLGNFSDKPVSEELLAELQRVDAKGEFKMFDQLPEASRLRCPQSYKELDERSRFRIVST